MEAAVERPDVGLRQAWQKVSPWLVAFFTQWLILTLAVVLYRVIEIAFILHFINPAFDKDQFLSGWIILWVSVLYSLVVLSIVWLIVFALKSIAPGVIRRLTPGALDKFLLPGPQETELENILSQRAKLTPDNISVAD